MAKRPNHALSYDFVADKTYNGKAFRMPCITGVRPRKPERGLKPKAAGIIEALRENYVGNPMAYVFTLLSCSGHDFDR
jgi:hypothetical protein